jgi:hypothetical protein
LTAPNAAIVVKFNNSALSLVKYYAFLLMRDIRAFTEVLRILSPALPLNTR